MSVSFQSGATTVSISDNYSPASEIVPVPGTLVGETAGGTVIGQALVPDRKFFHLEFLDLSLATKNSLFNFFYTTIRGRYTAFTFTDKDSTTYTVRWWNGWQIKPNPKANWTNWSGVIVLRVES